MIQSKLKVITDFDKLPTDIQEKIKLTYPEGFSDFLVEFKNRHSETVYALPYETEKKYYMVRMSVSKAMQLILDDDDYDDDGYLKDDKKDQFEDKHGEVEDFSMDKDYFV